MKQQMELRRARKGFFFCFPVFFFMAIVSPGDLLADFVYVTNSGDGTVSVIDTRTNRVLDLIPAGNGYESKPQKVAMTPDGKYAYTTNFSDGTVLVIDTRSNTVVGAPISVGSDSNSVPLGVAITPDGRYAYVANFNDGTVSVIDASSHSVVGSPIPVGSGPYSEPYGVAITPDGSFAYVTNSGDGTVSVIDTRNHTVLGSPIVVGDTPQGITIPADDRFAYVAWPENSAMSASDTKAACCRDGDRVEPIVEIKIGYFFFSNATMRKIYDQGGLDVQLSGSYPLWRWLQIYGSAEYMQKQGRSLNGDQKTSIWEIPLSLGLKPVIPVSSEVDYYFTLGPRYFFVHAHNHSSYVDRHLSQSGLGAFVNTGFNFFLRSYLVVDVFGEYSYKRMHFHSSKTNVIGNNAQIGGFVFGAGLGYAF